ncbi:MAG: hypothetical protein ACLSAP_01910 [Oscillospiraceae bacterium]
MIGGAAKTVIGNTRAQFGNHTIERNGAREPEVSDYLRYGESDLLRKTEFS